MQLGKSAIALFAIAQCFSSSAFVPSLLAADPPIQHSFFVAGPTFTGVIDEDGQEAWNSGRKGGRDGFVLPNGNFLIAWTDVAKEMTPDKQVIWEYTKSPDNREIGTVQRLPNGRTLVTELGSKPRLIEVNRAGQIEIDCPLLPETDNAHMQTRMARKLGNGNYLVPHLLAFQVKEYTSQGAVVKSFSSDLPSLGGKAAENWPFTAIRLDNGNSLVTLTHGNKVVEFDAAGDVVWMASNEDFAEKPFDDPCGAHRLPNGNTVIASYHSQKNYKAFEITRDKKLVWSYSGPHRVHELQVLTTNGVPLPDLPLK